MVFSLENLELLIAFYMATAINFTQTATAAVYSSKSRQNRGLT